MPENPPPRSARSLLPLGRRCPVGADEGAFTGKDGSRPSPVRPDDLRPRHRATGSGLVAVRDRKSWPHVLSPEGRGGRRASRAAKADGRFGAARSRLPLRRTLRVRRKEGGGWNATGLARLSQRSTRPPTGELSPMAFLVGVTARQPAWTPPPGAPGSLSPAVAGVDGSALAGLSDGAPPSPLDMTKAKPSSQGEAKAWLVGSHGRFVPAKQRSRRPPLTPTLSPRDGGERVRCRSHGEAAP